MIIFKFVIKGNNYLIKIRYPRVINYRLTNRRFILLNDCGVTPTNEAI